MNPSKVIDLVSAKLAGVTTRSMRIRKGTILTFSHEGLNVPVVVPDEPSDGEEGLAEGLLEVFEDGGRGKDLS